MRAILICPNDALRLQFASAVADHPDIVLSKVLTEYPEFDILDRLVRGWAPEVIFLDIEDETGSAIISAHLEKEFPTLQRVALHSQQEPAVFRKVLQLRMSELLSPPFEENEVNRMVGSLQARLQARPAVIGSTDHFYAFLPAKAGSGATTVAANATWAFSRASSEKKVLLVDFDTQSGIAGFMFNTEHEFFVTDAGIHARALDSETWQRLVKPVGNIDLMLSGAPYLEERVTHQQVEQIVSFARRNYGVICADLPDTFGESTVAVLKEANRIFVVVTPELPVLRLARLKTLTLRKLDLENKATLLVNRVSRGTELSREEIENTVGLPVYASFPSEYADVAKSIRMGQPAQRLEASMDHFTKKAMEAQVKEKRVRFIERFGVVPLRYAFR